MKGPTGQLSISGRASTGEVVTGSSPISLMVASGCVSTGVGQESVVLPGTETHGILYIGWVTCEAIEMPCFSFSGRFRV